MAEGSASASASAAECRVEDEETCEGSVPDRSNNVLEFLDSLDAYLVRMESLSSQLRQGWFELASARHSMGPYRINRVLLDHKDHSAASYLLLNEDGDGDNERSNPQFRLWKWGSSSNSKGTVEEIHDNSKMMDHTSDSQLRHRGTVQSSECKDDMPTKRSTLDEPGSPIQSERLKSLSVFGTLVSPKLRTAQLSFETALVSLVEIANLRSSVLSTYEKLAKELPRQRDDERTDKCKEVVYLFLRLGPAEFNDEPVRSMPKLNYSRTRHSAGNSFTFLMFRLLISISYVLISLLEHNMLRFQCYC